MEIKRDKLVYLLFCLLFFSCIPTSSKKIDISSRPWSFLILVRYLDDGEKEPIDIAEEFYLVTNECTQEKIIKIEGAAYGIFPVPFDHPNGVDLCCAEAICNNSKYSVDLNNYSYLNAEEEIRKIKSPKFDFGSIAKAQVFAIHGQFCICSSGYAQVTYEGFDHYAYLTRRLNESRPLTRKEKKRFKNILPRLKELIMIL